MKAPVLIVPIILSLPAFGQSGNVGVGTSTPSTPLHVVGTISSTSATTTAGSTETSTVPPGALELFRSTSSTASNVNGFIDFKDNNSKDFDLRLLYDHTLGTNGGFQIVTSTNGGANNAARLTVLNANGNVGIGTSTPGSTLDVKGGFTLRLDTVSIVSNAATIPSNVSQISLYGFATNTITVTPPTPASAGQQLTIFNNDAGGQVAIMNGYTISNGQSLTFRSNSTTAASFLPDANNFVRGALTIRQDSALVLSNAATIPTNASQVSVWGFPSGTVTITPPTPLNAGQILTVFNNTFNLSGYSAKMNGYTIPNGQSLTFRSNGNTAASFLPDANNFVNVRVLSSASFVTMLPTDYYIKFTASTTYSLDDPAANIGRVLYFYVGASSIFPGLSSSPGGIVNTGGTSSSSFLNLSPGNRVALISDGTNWVRMY